MKTTLITLRLLFVVTCALASWLVCLSIKEWDPYQGLALAIGVLIGALVVLVDVLLKGFSLRGLSALTFGLAVGSLIAYMISVSPPAGPGRSGDHIPGATGPVRHLQLPGSGHRPAGQG